MPRIAKHTWELLWQATEGLFNCTIADGVRNKNRDSGKIGPSPKELIMEVVYSRPEGIMLKDIARMVNRTPGAVSQIIEALVREGLVEREVSKHDRRSVTIYCSSMGVRMRDDYMQRLHSRMDEIMVVVPDKERTVFRKILAHIVEHCQDADPIMNTGVRHGNNHRRGGHGDSEPGRQAIP